MPHPAHVWVQRCAAQRPVPAADQREEITATTFTTAQYTPRHSTAQRRHSGPVHRQRRTVTHHGTTAGSAPSFGGEHVLDWLRSSEARNVVRRTARRYRLSGYDADEDTVLAEAAFAVWRRMQSPDPFTVRRPAGYGTAVIRSVLIAVIRVRDRSETELPTWLSKQAEPGTSSSTVTVLTRARVEHASGTGWLQEAALAYVDLAVGDLVLADDIPQPRSGATPAQARAWAALWIAGLEHLFPRHDTSATRKARSRKVSMLLQHVATASGHPGLHQLVGNRSSDTSRTSSSTRCSTFTR